MAEAEVISKGSAGVAKIPPWVYGVVGIGLLCAVLDAPTFPRKLRDSIEKERAERLDEAARYSESIPIYRSLHAAYPMSHGLTVALGLAQHAVGQYADALSTFSALAGQKMPKAEAERINAAIADSQRRLRAADPWVAPPTTFYNPPRW
jgi:hypothetical protein